MVENDRSVNEKADFSMAIRAKVSCLDAVLREEKIGVYGSKIGRDRRGRDSKLVEVESVPFVRWI